MLPKHAEVFQIRHGQIPERAQHEEGAGHVQYDVVYVAAGVFTQQLAGMAYDCNPGLLNQLWHVQVAKVHIVNPGYELGVNLRVRVHRVSKLWLSQVWEWQKRWCLHDNSWISALKISSLPHSHMKLHEDTGHQVHE